MLASARTKNSFELDEIEHGCKVLTGLAASSGIPGRALDLKRCERKDFSFAMCQETTWSSTQCSGKVWEVWLDWREAAEARSRDEQTEVHPEEIRMGAGEDRDVHSLHLSHNIK